MKGRPWFRLYAEAVDNDKLRLLAFEDRWHFVAVMCCKCQGILDSDDSTKDRRIAVKLGLSLNEADEVKRRLMEVGLVENDWQPCGWDERQFVSDADPTASERKRRQREKQQGKQQDSNVTDMSRVTHGNVTRTDTDTDTDTEYTFDQFWDQYPKKVGKKPSRTKWNRLTKGEQKRAIADVEKRKLADKQWKDGFAPNPLTYLNQARWEDDWSSDKSGNEPVGRAMRSSE